MATFIVRRKGGVHYSSICPALTSLWNSGCLIAQNQKLHTSQSFLIDRRKDRALIQHLHYKDYEKTMKHRNLLIHELPDYSYTDGRPTEIAIGQKQRHDKNYELAKQIVQLVGEMKFAQEQYVSQTTAASNQQQARLDSRLKEKGQKM